MTTGDSCLPVPMNPVRTPARRRLIAPRPPLTARWAAKRADCCALC